MDTRQIYEPVYVRYREIVERELQGITGRVFKLDLYNEEHGDWKSIPALMNYDVTYIEINLGRCQNVHTSHPEMKIVQGDIRHLPFKDKAFSVIVDLSTVDHIHPADLAQTIDEYIRVLEGKLIMVAWFREVIGEASEPWNPDTQYYLSPKELNCLSAKFNIVECKPFHEENGAQLLEICGNT